MAAGSSRCLFAGRLDEARPTRALSAADIADRFDTANIPVNTAPPAVDDLTPSVGETLTVQPGSWQKAARPRISGNGATPTANGL